MLLLHLFMVLLIGILVVFLACNIRPASSWYGLYGAMESINEAQEHIASLPAINAK